MIDNGSTGWACHRRRKKNKEGESALHFPLLFITHHYAL
jgi:hypothetical protein